MGSGRRHLSFLARQDGVSLRVIAFGKGDKEREALEAGADEFGGEEMAKRIQCSHPMMNSQITKHGTRVFPAFQRPLKD